MLLILSKNLEKKNINEDSVDETTNAVNKNKNGLPNISTNHNKQFLSSIKNRTNYKGSFTSLFNKSTTKKS